MRAFVTYRGPGAAAVRASLAPEAGREIPRTRVEVSGSDDGVQIRVEAEDVSALRAALNSYLRWTQVALDAYRTVSP